MVSLVAALWGAGAEHVALVQGLLAGLITAVGCFLGGWFCNHMKAHRAYALFGMSLAVIALFMAYSPTTVTMYVVWNMIYSLAVGLSYSAFTAMALTAIGGSAAATGLQCFCITFELPSLVARSSFRIRCRSLWPKIHADHRSCFRNPWSSYFYEC
jgi:uncharacterized membrane protein